MTTAPGTPDRSTTPTCRRRTAGAAVLAALVGLSACAFPVDDSFEEIEDVPFGLDVATTTSSTTSTTLPAPTTTADGATTSDPTTTLVATEAVQVYFVLGSDLAAQSIQLPSPVQPRQVVARLEEGPVPGPESVGLRTEVPSGLVADVGIERGVATVDLVGDVLTRMSVFEGRTAIAQVVLSLRLPGIGQVRFTSDGEPLAVPVPSRDNQLSEPGEALAFEDFEVLLRPSAVPITTDLPVGTTSPAVSVPATTP